MSEQSYLMVELGHTRYGITTDAVEELFLLPEITPIPEMPDFMIGMINLRGDVLPVIDLQRRLGQPSLPYQVNNSIVLIGWQGQRLGILVDRVDEVQWIDADQMKSHSGYGRSPQLHPAIAGIARFDTALVSLLNPDYLIQSLHKESFEPRSESFTESEIQRIGDPFAHLSAPERDVLRDRSRNLKRPSELQDTTGIPIAVIGLEDEYFGVGLEVVHEFTNLRKVTPVPCCPSYVLGNMNLRGEIVTVFDISTMIHVDSNRNNRKKAIVVRLGEITAGIAVDNIYDVVYLHPSEMLAAPIAVQSAGDDYLQGVAAYQNRMMSIINLPTILTTDALVVNEEV